MTVLPESFTVKAIAFDVRRSQPNLNTQEAYGTNI